MLIYRWSCRTCDKTFQVTCLDDLQNYPLPRAIHQKKRLSGRLAKWPTPRNRIGSFLCYCIVCSGRFSYGFFFFSCYFRCRNGVTDDDNNQKEADVAALANGGAIHRQDKPPDCNRPTAMENTYTVTHERLPWVARQRPSVTIAGQRRPLAPAGGGEVEAVDRKHIKRPSRKHNTDLADEWRSQNAVRSYHNHN